VQRYLALFGVQPHRSKSFKLSTDPFFVEKLRDVVGLYLNPPDNALILCVDEKNQVQALERTQPVLPMGLGYVEVLPTTMSGTAPRRCSRRSMSPTAKSLRNAKPGTGIRSS
jgi:putative transposase